MLFALCGASPAGGGGGNQAHTNGGAQGGQSENRGTEQNPLFFEQVETPQAEREAANIEDTDEQNEKINRHLLQATLVLAGVGFLQWLILAVQTWHIGRSTRVAERALTEIERPWLFIFIEHGTEEDNDPGFVKSATIHFRMANYGKAPAIIISAAVGAGATLTPETSLRDDLSNEVIAPAGESRFSHTFTSETGFFHDKDACIPQNTFLIPVQNQGERFFFCVDVTYTGVSPDTCYKTVCCWYWDECGTGWLRYEQPRYNYRT